MPASRPETRHARHLFTIWVDGATRDRLIEELQKEGVSVMVNYRPVHLLSYFAQTYGYQNGNFPNAEKIGRETLSLPFYPNMPLEFVEHVTQSLKRVLGVLV